MFGPGKISSSSSYFQLVDPHAHRVSALAVFSKSLSGVSRARLQTSLELVTRRLSARSAVSPWHRLSSTLRLLKSVSSPGLELWVPNSPRVCSIFTRACGRFPLPVCLLGRSPSDRRDASVFCLPSWEGLCRPVLKPSYMMGAVTGENTRESAIREQTPL